ncbi:MAG: YlbG family protein [Aerococcus sp.]|nr:YlbG family protein [Aerococcus sp.]
MEKRLPEQTRQELIVWLHSTKKTYQLKKYGYIYHISWRMKYAVMYVDHDKMQATIAELKQLKNVRKVEISANQEINMDFSTALDLEAERIEANRKHKEAD